MRRKKATGQMKIKLTRNWKRLELQKDIICWQSFNTQHIYRLKYLNWTPQFY